MEPFTEFVILTVISFAGLAFAYVRRKSFELKPKTKKPVNDYTLDFIEWLLISWPPLFPLVGVVKTSGQGFWLYLIPYSLVIVGIFFVWFMTTQDQEKRRQSGIPIAILIIIWVVIGCLMVLLINH